MSGFAHDAVLAWRTLGVVLLHGTALAALAWILSATLLRNARPALVAALWSIVLLKFLLPVGPALPFSLSDALARIFSSAPAPEAAPPYAGNAMVGAPPLHGPGLVGWLALAGAALWLAGVAMVAARGARHARRARRGAQALAPVDPVTDAVACGIAERLGLARTPELRLSPSGTAPWLVGLRRPIVVVPSALAARRADLTAALTHELAHLRRRDVWLRLAQVVVGSVFFFWPVVRWVNRRIDAAREMACDAWAIAEGPLPAADYARMLVGMVRGQRERAPSGALGLAATPGLLRGRVDAVLAARPGQRPGLGKVGAAGLAIWTVLALGGARAARSDATAAKVCRYSQAMADALYAAHPEADRDGDGVLTREEACGFQLARRITNEAVLLGAEPMLADATFAPEGSLDPEHLCCNCSDSGSTSPVVSNRQPEPSPARPALEPVNTCVRGVTP